MTTSSPPSSFPASLKRLPIAIVAVALFLLVIAPLALYSAPDAVFQAFKTFGGNEVTLVEFTTFFSFCVIVIFLAAFIAFVIGAADTVTPPRSFGSIGQIFLVVGVLSGLNLLTGMFANIHRTSQFVYVAEQIEEVAPHSPVAQRIRQAITSPAAFGKERAWLRTLTLPIQGEAPRYGLEALERIAPALSARAIPAVADTIAEVGQTGVLTRQHRITIYQAILEHPELLESTDAERLASLFAPQKAPPVF